MSRKKEYIRINPADSVAVALQPLAKGTDIILNDVRLTLLEDIPQGHKFALHTIGEGEAVIKYGNPIGNAKVNISKGSWVHVHNMKTGLGDLVDYSYRPEKKDIQERKPDEFMGFRRVDGSVGVRNEIWVIPTVGCVNSVAEKIAELSRQYCQGTVDAIVAFPHPYGCSQMGEDQENSRKILADLINHPNAGGVLVLGLGCENSGIDILKQYVGDYDGERIKFLNAQDCDNELEEGVHAVRELLAYAGTFKREPISCSELIIGMKCGGSDGLSGITANPTVGGFSDLLISRGGTTILTEVPEMFGAEGFLMNRCVNKEVFDKAVNMINGFKNYFISHHEVVYDNPSPGNRQGGITTLEDKSCGCVQKGGTAPIMDVIGYGDAVVTKGLNMPYGPGNDLVSATAMTAAGAHLILFTTGRGTPFGAPAPTLKLSTNSRLAENKKGWIDFDAGPIVEGESIDDAAKRLLQLVIEVANGKETQTEKRGYRSISIFKDGVVL